MTGAFRNLDNKTREVLFLFHNPKMLFRQEWRARPLLRDYRCFGGQPENNLAIEEDRRAALCRAILCRNFSCPTAKMGAVQKLEFEGAQSIGL